MTLELFLIGTLIFVTIVFRLWMNEYDLKRLIKTLDKKILQLEEDKSRAEHWRDQWYKHYQYFSDLSDKISARNVALMKENKDLKRENLKLRMRGSHTFIIDEDAKAAIRYAMIHSHPDKGGKEEDFIRFHSLYEKIKSK
jgi:regulator of replication initiation timing